MPKGSLTIVGTGIRAISHITNEARIHMERADFLFHLVADPLTSSWIQAANPNSRSLMSHYDESLPRLHTYNNMVDEIFAKVQSGLNICFALYGHPSVFVYPSHELVRRCREKGVDVEVCPGVSADACLYADLSVDPAKDGLISYEATDFLIFNRPLSTSCGVVLWQIGVIGDLGYHRKRDVRHGLSVLKERLLVDYPEQHEVLIYEAATLPTMPSKIQRVTVGSLDTASVTAISTLYLPPASYAELNQRALESLGLTEGDICSQSASFQRRRRINI